MWRRSAARCVRRYPTESGAQDEEGEVLSGLRVDGHGQADAVGVDHAPHGGSAQAEPGCEQLLDPDGCR